MTKKAFIADFEIEFGEEEVTGSVITKVDMQEVVDALNGFMADAVYLKQTKPTRFAFRTKNVALSYEELGQAIVDSMQMSVCVTKFGLVSVGQVTAY